MTSETTIFFNEDTHWNRKAMKIPVVFFFFNGVANETSRTRSGISHHYHV